MVVVVNAAAVIPTAVVAVAEIDEWQWLWLLLLLLFVGCLTHF